MVLHADNTQRGAWCEDGLEEMPAVLTEDAVINQATCWFMKEHGNQVQRLWKQHLTPASTLELNWRARGGSKVKMT